MSAWLKRYGLLGLLGCLCVGLITSCHIEGSVTKDGKPIEGVTVFLSDGTDQRSTQTDEDGAYGFSDVPKGVYTVTILAPFGYSGKAEQRVYKTTDSVDKTGIDFALDSSTLKTITSGQVIGTRDANGIPMWMGIPFAAPPVGNLRWKAPVEPESWGDAPYIAVATGAPGPQYLDMINNAPANLYGGLMGSEDCLYLNVWAPETTGLKPVMFWIHGGGESMGEGGVYNGRKLAEIYDVVVVTINYRLGPFGWFSHPKLNADGTDVDRSGNFGTLDIIKALAWVQDNIAAFGGDKDNVMVFGESAGGLNTLTMLASPLSSGLFHKAAVHSAALDWVPEQTVWLTRERAENYTDDSVPGVTFSSSEIINSLLVSKGFAADRESAKTLLDAMAPGEVQSFMESLSTDDLMLSYDYEERLGGIIIKPAVIRDGTVIPDMDLYDLFESGDYNQVPTIVGTNRDEYKLFMMMMPEYVNNVYESVPLVLDSNDYALSAYYYSESWKAVAADKVSDALCVNQSDSVYTYRFDWDDEPDWILVDVGFVIGAAHGMEIPFVFADPDDSVVESKEPFLYTRWNQDGRYALAETMSSYWVSMAYNGKPGTGMSQYPQDVEWTPWNRMDDTEKLMVFDTPEEGGSIMSDVRASFDEIKAELQEEEGYNDPMLKCETYRYIFGEDEFYLSACSEQN